MASPREDIKKYANDLWQQAIDQIEEAKVFLVRSRDKFEEDFHRVRLERDKLLRTLGEQTLKLNNQGKITLPSPLRKTIEKLNEVIEELQEKRPESNARPAPPPRPANRTASPAKSSSKSKEPKKATSKKVTQKVASETGKKVTGKKVTGKR